MIPKKANTCRTAFVVVRTDCLLSWYFYNLVLLQYGIIVYKRPRNNVESLTIGTRFLYHQKIYSCIYTTLTNRTIQYLPYRPKALIQDRALSSWRI